MELAGRGKDVILAVEETYPAANICGQCLYRRQEVPEGFFPEECFAGDVMVPDRCKRYLEERCMKAGVRLYYGLYFVEEAVDQCSQSSSSGGKGRSGVRCMQVCGMATGRDRFRRQAVFAGVDERCKG